MNIRTLSRLSKTPVSKKVYARSPRNFYMEMPQKKDCAICRQGECVFGKRVGNPNTESTMYHFDNVAIDKFHDTLKHEKCYRLNRYMRNFEVIEIDWLGRGPK